LGINLKAIVRDEYGPPDVLKREEVERPVPKDRELLVRVHATTVNFGDLLARDLKNMPLARFHMPWPLWLPVRIAFGWNKPKVRILGSEFSGVVESAGKDVQEFRKGDEVFGYLGQRMGAYAEFLCVPEDKMVGIKPKNMTHGEAASIPYGAIMAQDHLRRARIRPGQKVLVNGASGAIGSAAVQLAKYYGAEVTGVSGAPGQDYMKALGADHVIDYGKEDFATNGEAYDIIYDILGKRSFSECKDSLTEDGTYLNASFKTGKIFQMVRTRIVGKKKVLCPFARERHEDMASIRELAEAGNLKAVIDRTFPLEKAAEAHRHAEEGRKRGPVVITIVQEAQA
jgi:NADPH:quinone reductase-like Zn-dependent oxidoreductase